MIYSNQDMDTDIVFSTFEHNICILSKSKQMLIKDRRVGLICFAFPECMYPIFMSKYVIVLQFTNTIITKTIYYVNRKNIND